MEPLPVSILGTTIQSIFTELSGLEVVVQFGFNDAST